MKHQSLQAASVSFRPRTHTHTLTVNNENSLKTGSSVHHARPGPVPVKSGSLHGCQFFKMVTRPSLTNGIMPVHECLFPNQKVQGGIISSSSNVARLRYPCLN